MANAQDEYAEGENIEPGTSQEILDPSTQDFKSELKEITKGHFGENILEHQRDEKTGLEITYDTFADLNRVNISLLFNSDIRDLTDMFVAELNFGLFIKDNRYFDFFVNTQSNKYGTMASKSGDISSSDDVTDNTKESFFSFGFGPTYRTYFIRDLIPLDNIFETVHAGIGLGWFFENLSNQGYFGPGVKSDLGIHYRLSKQFHVGTKLSWSHYWVKRDEKFVDEPQGNRTISVTWLSFGLDFALYF